MNLVTSLRLGLVGLLVLSGCAAESADDASDAAAESEAAIASTSRDARTITAFDGAVGELPEGLALKDGAAYVGFAPTGTIDKIDLAKGTRSTFAQLPRPVPNKGFMTGLAWSKTGTLYAALVSFTPEVQAGIYSVSPLPGPLSGKGGVAKLFASHAEMSFPNGIAFDRDGALLVTDSGRGAIFRIDDAGRASIWADGDALKGQQNFCGEGVGAGFDIGANGIAVRGDEVVVANNDKASLLSIAIGKDGRAGAFRTIAQDCERLGGADGIAVDRSDVVVATNRLGKVVRVSRSGAVRTVTSEGLDFPASVTSDRGRLFVTSFAFANASSGREAHPALVELR